jgi:hypothetical protein
MYESFMTVRLPLQQMLLHPVEVADPRKARVDRQDVAKLCQALPSEGYFCFVQAETSRDSSSAEPAVPALTIMGHR